MGKVYEEKKEYKNKLSSLELDRAKNPHLALISDHLWWLALMVKISLAIMILTIVVVILSFPII